MKTNTPADFQQLPDKSFTLKLTLEKSVINTDYHRALTQAQTNFAAKGFRKGKAPLDVVKANVSQDALFEEILSHLLSHLYEEKILELKLHPIIDPQIQLLNAPLSLDKDWQVEIKSCELPEIKLDPKYQDEIKKINTSVDEEKIRLNKIMEFLIKSSTVDLPQMLIDHDVQKHLTDLVDQVQSAGLTVTQYLKSKNETQDTYIAKIQKQVTDEWKLNLCISQISVNEKIEVKKEEVDEVVGKQPELKDNLNLVYYLLTQQKVLDFLKKL